MCFEILEHGYGVMYKYFDVLREMCVRYIILTPPKKPTITKGILRTSEFLEDSGTVTVSRHLRCCL